MEILKEMPPRNPINGTFELTIRCNLKCKMCLFRHDDSENLEIMANEKTAEEWIDMARQVADAGTLHILITGGEPMLRSDFCEIYEGIYKQGFMITLYTNATLVTSKIMDTLVKYPPHKIGITLYGASAKTYENVCKNSKAFDSAIDGIKKLKALPSKLEIRTTLVKDNVNDIERIEEISQKLIGKDAKVIHTSYVLKSVRGGICNVENSRLSPKENLQLLLKRTDKLIEQYFKDREISVPSYKYSYDNEKNESMKNKITLLGCDAGMDSYTISWDGKLLGCQILGCFYTDPYKEGFKSAWDRYPTLVKIPHENNKCKFCDCREYCSMCYGIHYSETGNFNDCPRYFYDVAKALKELIIN